MRSDATPELTVVIVARDAAGTVRDCLGSLRRQRTARSFETILVDSSGDGTEEIVAREFPEVRLLHFDQRKYCGDGRNIGVGQARAPIVAFLDADCVADEDWVEEVIRAHAAADAAIGGAIANREPSSPVAWAAYFCEFSQWMPGLPARRLEDMAGANLSFKVAVLREVGPFIEGTYCSDTELNWRLATAGHTIRFEPAIRVAHTYRGSLLEYLRHELAHGRAFARVRVAAGRLRSWRRPAYVAATPLVAAVLTWRVARRVAAAGGMLARFLPVSPLVVAGVLAWSLGEAVGAFEGKAS